MAPGNPDKWRDLNGTQPEANALLLDAQHGFVIAVLEVLAVLILLSAVLLGPSVVHAKPRAWKRYRNAATGLSFEYPAEYPAGLHVRERDPRRVGLPAADAIVDLLDANGTLWLRFLVNHGSASSNANTIFTIPPDFDRSCKPLRLTGAEAFVCISHGRAAAHWGVQILAPRDCSIQSAFDTPPLRDRYVPVLSIIRTVRFTGAVGLVHAHIKVPHWPTTVKLVVPPSSGSTSAAGIFVSNYNGDIHNPFYGNSITAYPLKGSGNLSPSAVIADWPRTGLAYARGIALDSRGYIYVTNQATLTGGVSVKVYPPGRTLQDHYHADPGAESRLGGGAR
ncbi:MAG TPA: hypothetical protein VMV15_12620 [Candidatus Binataceae bacterium]|nr:hypothetical protein [Candidatus Binataceae bacterium]